MSNLTFLTFNGQEIRFKIVNGIVWVNLTDMAKATGKRVNNWSQLQSTTEYLQELKLHC